MANRRAFLKDAAIVAAGAFAALGMPLSVARALPVRFISALDACDADRAYAVPTADGVSIDRDEQVIVARYQNKVYAFSLACPHQNTALRWDARGHEFQCPKHHSRYQPDGTFIDGRATRGMDRFALRREGENVVVDLDKLYQQDLDAQSWSQAVVTV